MRVAVGIFWVIRGKAYWLKQEKETEEEKEKVRVKLTGIIDSDHGHFQAWDELCGREYPHADFATYPRGRVVYDLKNGLHIVYADKCVRAEELKSLAEVFGLEAYERREDEHYACDRCLKFR